jgi:hypothetical protein
MSVLDELLLINGLRVQVLRYLEELDLLNYLLKLLVREGVLSLDLLRGDVDHGRDDDLGSLAVVESCLVVAGVLKQAEDEVAMVLVDRFLELSQLIILPFWKLVKAILEVFNSRNCGISDLNQKTTVILKLLNKTEKESNKKG